MTDYNSATYLGKVDAWWWTANYIAVPQMYLKNNRFHLAQDAANVVYGVDVADFSQKMIDALNYHHAYIRANGKDIPEVENWQRS